MSKSASIQKMSSRHEAILQFMIGNPLLKMSKIAAHFGVTPAWLSTIVWSDAFQNQLARRHDELFDCAVVQELGDKVSAAAHMTMDEYLEKIPTMTTDQLINGSDKLLKTLGYGASAGTTNFNLGDGAQVQVNHNQVGAEVLAKAREKIGKSQVGATDSLPALQVEPSQIAAETQGDSVREEGELPLNGSVRPDFIYPEHVVQVSNAGGQDKILPD